MTGHFMTLKNLVEVNSLDSSILLTDHCRTGEVLGSLNSASSHFHGIALFTKTQVRVPHGNTSQALNN